MNKTYKAVCNVHCQAWITVSESNKAQEKRGSSTATLSNKPSHLTASVLLLTGLTLISHSTLAADLFWDVTTGNWLTGTNWNGGTAPPTSSDSATIDNGGTAQINSAGEAATVLKVGDTNAGTLAISNGGGISNTSGIIGDDSGSTGSVTVDSAGSTWTNSNNLTVGNSGTGTLSISNGGDASSLEGKIGNILGSTGSVTVDSAGSTWTNSSNLTVGNSGTGTLVITNEGAVSNIVGFIGDDSGSSGSVTVDGLGSKWLNSNNLAVGNNSTGTLAITNKALVSNTSGFIGNGLDSSGSVTVDGAGSIWTNSNHLFVGNNGTATLVITNGASVSNKEGDIGNNLGSTGNVTLDGADSTWTNSNRLYVGDAGTGMLSIINGGAVSNTVGSIGERNTGSVTVDDVGSMWVNSSNLFVGNEGTGALTITNGGLVSNTVGSIGDDSGSTGSVKVDGAGSTWTNSGELKIGNTGMGTLTISNQGVVDVGTGSGNVTLANQAGSEGTLIVGATFGDNALSAGTLNAGNVSFGSGTGKLVFNHTNTNYHFNPDITGAGAIGLYSGTTYFDGNLNSYTGQLAVDGGTLSIADGETLSLGGDYTQTVNGLLRTNVSSASSYGQLAVAGSATFAVDSKIDIDVSTANTLIQGNVLSAVISAGTLSASTFALTDNSALFNFTATVNGNQVDITTQTAPTTTVLGSVINNDLPSGIGAAAVLDGFITAGTINTDIDNVVTALGQLETEAQVAQAAAETLPFLVANTVNILNNNQRATGNVVYSRVSSLQGLSSGDGFVTDKHLWLKPIGSWSKQDKRHNVSGYEAESYGFVAGIDSEVNEGANLGFGLSYMNTGVDGQGTGSGNSASIDSYQMISYGRQAIKGFADVDVIWQASVGFNQVDGRRQISFINRRAQASYDSTSAQLDVGVTKAIAVSESTTVVQSLRADYSYIREESYKEKGAGALNLDVDANDAEQLSVMAEATLNHQFNANTRLAVNIGAGYDVINERASITSRYSGGGAAFVTKGIDPNPWRVKAGIGIAITSSEASTITAVYDVEKRSDFLNQTASVKFRWEF